MGLLAPLAKIRDLLASSNEEEIGPIGRAVPIAHMRDDAPSGNYFLAAEYLLADTRLRRRETTFNAYLSEVGTRTIEVDFSLPTGKAEGCTCYVPVAFLPKGRVAPSLEVRDAAGNVLAIPTKRENMALTERAIENLIAADALQLHDSAKSRELIREVISHERLIQARVSRILLEGHEPSAKPLFAALGLLEDHFLLWVPIQGAPASQHHVSICRSEPHGRFPLFKRRRRPVVGPVDTALGQAQVRVGDPTGRWTFDFFSALKRFLNAFALHPLEAGAREFEAARFASCHLRFHAPDGFLIRNLRVGVGDGSATHSDEGRIEELDPSDPHAVVQGFDHDVGHVHLSMTDNPQRIYLNVALGLRGGNTTLWMLATVLTAVLLWLVHHHASYGPPKFQNKQIVAAALLVVPAFASAWSLRAEGGELLRTSLAGARVLLLASAALSVATALALAGILPFGLDRYDTISVYGAASYFVALALITAWLLSGRPTWQLYRHGLRTPARNLLAILLIGVLVGLVGLHHGLPLRLAGLILLVAGLGLCVISANTIAEPLRSSRTLYRPLAALGALPVLFAAGYFLGFYTNRFDLEILRYVCQGAGGALIFLSSFGFLFAESGKLQETRP
jgi:hypothetical protein